MRKQKINNSNQRGNVIKDKKLSNRVKKEKERRKLMHK